MKKSPLLKKLEQILATEAFESLDPFKEADHWHSLTTPERELLGLLFLKLGEKQLKEQDPKGSDSLNLAIQIAPKSYAIYYQMGLVLGAIKDVESLIQASEAFEKALDLKPDAFEAWLARGKTFMSIGIIQSDANPFQDAHHCFEKAHAASQDATSSQKADLFWQWARNSFCHGKLSGEALDFRNALHHFQNSADLHKPSAEFWNEYGDTLQELAHLLGRQEFLFEAIDRYYYALREDSQNFGTCLCLGFCFKQLFEATGESDYFQLANENFQRAAAIKTDQSVLWLKWGQLFISHGKINRNLESIYSSFEKFSKADALQPNQATILSQWGEAEMLYGTHCERIDYLRASESKILRSLALNSNCPEVWCIYGMCLSEQGSYFNDEEFHLKAIEKFHYGLSLNQSDPLLWYGLSLAHFAVGEIRQDVDMIEKSVNYSSRVLEFGGQVIPQFWNDWGVALMKLGEMTGNKGYIESAVEKFEHAINQHPDEEPEPEWLYNYGCALDYMGDFLEDPSYYEKAVQILAKVLQIDPQHSHARYNLALALSHLGEAVSEMEPLLRASEHFEILLNQDNEDEMGWNDWGLTLLHIAQLVHDQGTPQLHQRYYEEAESKFLHAIALGCSHSFYNLGCLYSLNGNISFAIHYLERSESAGTLPSLEDIMHDEWLENIRETPPFKNFIAHLSSKNPKES